MRGHRVEAIANEFLKRAQSERRRLTNMQLQKLPYVAQGWNLVLNKAPLIREQPRAWPYGPVYPTLYGHLKRYGSSDITDVIHEEDGNPFAEDRGAVIEALLQPEEEKLLSAVWSAYKNHTAFQLSALTHQPDSPWAITMRDRGTNAPIPNEVIQKHFLDLAQRRKRAT